MTPLTENPTVVVRVSPDGKLVDVASNVSQDLKVVIVGSATAYADEAANKPFDTTRPVQPTQVLAMRK